MGLRPSRTPALRVEIGRLVAHGMMPADAQRMAASLKRELHRLARGGADAFADARMRRARPVHATVPDDPAALGRAVAAGLWARIRDAGGVR